jgi:broad specificity phosphatase PhoE
MTEIILVRHGETEWNIEEVFRGRIDIELNEAGIKQAELLAEYLRDLRIDAIYSSPLKRALKTAEMIAGYYNLDVEITPGLIDFDFGQWQGLSHQEVKGRYKELYAQWIKNPHWVKMPAGESLNDVRERAIGVVNRVVARYEGTVVLVSHRVVNKVLICTLLGLDNSHFWNIRQDTCGITTFSYQNERFILTKHNDISFLKLIQKAALPDF